MLVWLVVFDVLLIDYLDNNDSYVVLKVVGDLLMIGVMGINVVDL